MLIGKTNIIHSSICCPESEHQHAKSSSVPASDGAGRQPAAEDPEEGGAAAEQDQHQPQPRTVPLRVGAPNAPGGHTL